MVTEAPKPPSPEEKPKDADTAAMREQLQKSRAEQTADSDPNKDMRGDERNITGQALKTIQKEYELRKKEQERTEGSTEE